MSRPVTTHKTPGLNDAIDIWASSIVDKHGASIAYQLQRPDALIGGSRTRKLEIEFQNGPVVGQPNGFSDEALLAILIDHLEHQANPPFCLDTADAIYYMRAALWTLKDRARRTSGIETLLAFDVGNNTIAAGYDYEHAVRAAMKEQGMSREDYRETGEPLPGDHPFYEISAWEDGDNDPCTTVAEELKYLGRPGVLLHPAEI